MKNNFESDEVIINSENISRLTKLYGVMDNAELQQVINKHLAVAIDCIFEDMHLE